MKLVTEEDRRHLVASMRDGDPYYYLATVYTKHEGGKEVAYDDAAFWTASLIKRGIPVLCPITHTHRVGWWLGDAYGHEEWMAIDRPFMMTACGLIVIMLTNWRDSDGIAEEITTFRKQGKPIYYIDPETGAWFHGNP